MTWQPKLSTECVELRALTRADEAALTQAAGDPLIWEQHPQPTRYLPEVFATFFADALASGGALAVIERKSGAMIGSSRFYNPCLATSSVEIGYSFLTRAFWGKEYNRQVKALMLDYAFTLVEQAWFVVGMDNRRSRRAMEKLGATLWMDPSAPQVIDNLEGRVVYGIHREDWARLRV